jgi:hypothetical protein
MARERYTLPRLALALLLIAAVLVTRRQRSTRAPSQIAAPTPSIVAAHVTPFATPKTAAPFSLPDRWRQVAARPPAVARDAELADMLEELADRDPDLAADLLSSLDELDRRRVVAAVLVDAAREPAKAVQFANEFCDADPCGAIEHGYSFVTALARVGEFAAAVEFVQLQSQRTEETENASKWLARIFAQWTASEPASAAERALALPASSLRGEALRAVAVEWARADMSGLAGFLSRLPASGERGCLVNATLPAWAASDPAAAAAWLARFSSAEEFDAGAATLATTPRVLATAPATAAQWAERIAEPTLRSNTLAAVLQSWATIDAAAARRFFESCPDLIAADRARLASEWSPRPRD